MTRVRRIDALQHAQRDRALKARPRQTLRGRDVDALRARRRPVRRRDGWAVRCARVGFVLAVGVFAFGLWSQPVRTLEIDGAVLHAEDDVLARLAALRGERWLTLETEDVSASIRSMDWVRDVRFVRELPDAVRVELIESRPVARVERDDTWWGVGDDGRVAALPAGVEITGLPVVTGLVSEDGRVDASAARRFRALVDALRTGGWPFAGGLARVELDGVAGLALRTGRDIEIWLGARDPAGQIRTAAAAWAHLSPQPGDRLDLRFSSQAVLTRSEG